MTFFIYRCMECNQEIHLHPFHKRRIKLKNTCEHIDKLFIFDSYTIREVERILNIRFRHLLNSDGHTIHYLKEFNRRK